MNRSLAATLLLAALAACKIGGSNETDPPNANCTTADGTCARHADCCSYACVNGFCERNLLTGGICRTSNDCDWTMTCIDYACTPGAVCRNVTDVCTYDNACCSGNCDPGGVCQANHPPTADLGANRAIAYWAPQTLTATASDPDVGDVLRYTWTLVSGPAGNTVPVSTSTGTVGSLSFFPDVDGPYTFTVTVTDGPSTQRYRLTATATVTLTAINDPPVVCAEVPCAPAPNTTTQSRNVQATLTGSVSDATVGDATHPRPNVSCKWYATPPSGTEAEVATFATCPAQPTYSFTPPFAQTSEGNWTFRLEATDGLSTVSDTRVIQVVNDPPVAEAGPMRTVNFAAGDASGPTVSATATQTDPNGDTSFTYTWTFDSVAPSSALTSADLVNAGTATVTFTPDRLTTTAAQYVLRVRICDRTSSCGEDTVAVEALKHVADLGHPVADAEWAAGRIFTVGANPAVAGQGKLWVYTGTTLDKEVSLATAPTSVGVDPLGRMVVAADDIWVRWVDVSVATPAPDAIAAPFAVGDVAVASSRCAVLFPSTGSSYLRVLDTSGAGGSINPTTRYGRYGTVDPAGGHLFVYDQTSSDLGDYTVSNSCVLSTPVTQPTYTCAGRLWASQASGHVVNGCAEVYSTALAYVKTLSGATSLQHAHTASTTGELVALAPSSATLRLYGATFDPAATPTVELPRWGFSGTGYTPTAKFAFVSANGATRWVIVEANGHTGIVTFP